MDQVDWGADAAVMLLPVDSLGSEGGGTFFTGTLADAVLYVLDLPESTRQEAEIVLPHDAGTRNSWLKLADIEALALRPDYPHRMP